MNELPFHLADVCVSDQDPDRLLSSTIKPATYLRPSTRGTSFSWTKLLLLEMPSHRNALMQATLGWCPGPVQPQVVALCTRRAPREKRLCAGGKRRKLKATSQVVAGVFTPKLVSSESYEGGDTVCWYEGLSARYMAMNFLKKSVCCLSLFHCYVDA